MRIRVKNFSRGSIGGTILLVVILTSIVYANSLINSFVWDDFIVIVNNDFIKSWKNFPSIFSREYLASTSEVNDLEMDNIGSGESSYRPVVTTSYFIDYSLWKLNPFGYHLTNLFLHIFNVILLYLLLNLIVKNKKIALLVSLLFALHPVNAEAVNCISFREDLLVFLFFTSSFILFIKTGNYNSIKRIYYYVASVTLYLLALFSKEMAITLPIILMLYDYYFVYRGRIREIFTNLKSRYLGYIAASIFYLWVWFFPMANMSELTTKYPGGTFYTNILTMFKVVVVYIRWLFIPINIHATLAIPDSNLTANSLFTPGVFLSVFLVLICILIAVKTRRTSKEISFSILWFFITLLPVSNIFPTANVMIASRFLYLPALGFCFLIAVLLFKIPALKVFSISSNILKRILNNIIIAILILYSVFTIVGNLFWRNNVVLWLEMVRYYPDRATVYNSLGISYSAIGNNEKAISSYKKSIELDPNYALTHYNLGLAYGCIDNIDEEIASYKKAIEVYPNFAQVYNNLGAAYRKLGKIEVEIALYKKAIEINPEYAGAYYNLAIAYKRNKEYDLAIECYDKARELGFINHPLLESLELYRKQYP